MMTTTTDESAFPKEGDGGPTGQDAPDPETPLADPAVRGNSGDQPRGSGKVESEDTEVPDTSRASGASASASRPPQSGSIEHEAEGVDDSEPGAAPLRTPGETWTMPVADDWRPFTVDSGLYQGRLAATTLENDDGTPELAGQDSIRPHIDDHRELTKRSADIELDFGYVGDSTVYLAAASIRGSSHYRGNSLPCQDRYHFAVIGDFLLFAVADGVSAAKHSHHGAQIACRVALGEVGAQLRQPGSGSAAWNRSIDWARVARQCQLRLLSAFNSRFKKLNPGSEPPTGTTAIEEAVGELATTLDVGVIATRPTVAGLYPYVVTSIAGDSSAMVADSDKGWNVLYRGKEPAPGELASNAVNPLPRSGTLHACVAGELEPGQSLTLMTDGLGDIIGGGTLPVGRVFLEGIQSGPVDSLRFLELVSVLNANGTDDRTAVTVWCGEPTSAP